VTREIAAEAAVWVARLHGPDRSPAMERELQAWQALSPAHREAFERCTDVWMEVPSLKLADAYRAGDAARASRRRADAGRAVWRWAVAVGAAALVAGGALLVQRWQDKGLYRTAVGEQRLVVLDDGTRMTLNTDTTVRVAYGAAQRSVEVGEGEALFEVAKDAGRPFVVRVSGSEVVALGTAFAVRFIDGPQAEESLAVTLIEGQVSVRPAAARDGHGLAPTQATTLKSGDRLQLDPRAGSSAALVAPSLDRPNVDQVVAWKRSEVVFHDTRLVDAVSEMNRYSRTPLVLSEKVLAAGLRVSGVFRTGDSAAFARAVATLHGLSVQDAGGRLELTPLASEST